MIRYFLITLAALLAAAGLGVLIQRDPGYILISVGGTAIETTFWLGLLLFLAMLVVGYYLLRTLQVGFRGTGRLSGYLSQRRHRRSIQKTNQGLIALIEGNYSRARQLLVSSVDDVDEPLLNYLGAALASDALDDDKAVRKYLREAEGSTSGAGIAVDLAQAQLLLGRGKLEESLASLTRAQRNAARHPAVLRLLKDVYVGLADWDSLLELLPELKKNKLLEADDLQNLRRRAALGQLQKRLNDAGALKQWWDKLPRELQSDPELVEVYVRQLVAGDGEAQAEQILRRQLRREWRRELVELYGLVAGSEPDKQLLAAESWLQERNNDPALLLALGRLSLRNQLWGKAREYFESSYRLEPGADVCAELGRLLAYLGEHERSTAFFQEGLQKSARALPLKLPTKVEPSRVA